MALNMKMFFTQSKSISIVYIYLCLNLVWTTIQKPIMSSAHQIDMREKRRITGADDCHIQLNRTSGNISVPRSLLKSHQFIQCEWTILLRQPVNIQLHFHYVKFLRGAATKRCVNNFLEYGHLDYSGHKVIIEEVCGRTLPEDFISYENTVWLRYFYAPEPGDVVVQPFLISYKAVPNEHIRNTTVVLSSLGTLTAIGVAACIICYCHKKKKKDLYYHRRQQQKRLKRIKKRSGLEETPTDWRRAAFHQGQNGHIPQVTEKTSQSLSRSCSTSATSCSSSQPAQTDEGRLNLKVKFENYTICDEPTKYEDIADFLEISKQTTKDTTQLPAPDDPEEIYLTLFADASSDSNMQPSPCSCESGRAKQSGYSDKTYLSFKAMSLSESNSGIAVKSTPELPEPSAVSSNYNTSRDSKIENLHANRHLSWRSLDSTLQKASPLCHSTPALDHIFCDRMEIPIICINDQLLSPSGDEGPQSSSAPDLSPSSQIILSSYSANRHDNTFCNFSKRSLRDSKSEPRRVSIVRPRPKANVSPLVGVSPGQIPPDLFRPRNGGIKTAKGSPGEVLSCLFKQDNSKSLTTDADSTLMNGARN